MSQIIKTNEGYEFNYVTEPKKDGDAKKYFILRCPDCEENLVMTAEMLDGQIPMRHESKKFPDSFCTFGRKAFPIGASLVAAIQANRLMEYGSPFTNLNDWIGP